MISYRCIVILLAFLFCLSSAAPITFTLDSSSSTDGIDKIITNESQQNMIVPWSTMERGASILFRDMFQKLSSRSTAKAGQYSSNLRRRIARRRHP